MFVECFENERGEAIDSYINNLINVETLFDSSYEKYVELWQFSSSLVKT